MVVVPNRKSNVPQKWNYIISMWQSPCKAPTRVYVEALKKSSLILAINLACFDFSDAIRWVFNPGRLPGARGISGARGIGASRGGGRRKGRKGGKPKKIGRRRNRRLTNFFDFEGPHNQELDNLRGRKVSAGVRSMWELDGVIQRYLYWLLIMEEGTNFFYNFTTLVWKSPHCGRKPGTGYASGGRDGAGLTPLFGWVDIPAFVQYKEGDIFYEGGGVACGEAQGLHVVASVAGGKVLSGSPQIEIRIVSAGGIISQSDPAGSHGGSMDDCITNGYWHGNGCLQAQWRVTGGSVTDCQTSVTAWAYINSDPPISGVNCNGIEDQPGFPNGL